MSASALAKSDHMSASSAPSEIVAQAKPGSNASGEIAYVLMGFPRLSETFVTHEIYLLEQLGIKLRLFAIKHGDMEQVHDVVAHIRAPLTYLPKVTSLSGTNLFSWIWRNGAAYAESHGQLLRARPFSYLKTLSAALSMAIKYRRSWHAPLRKVFVKEFLQAGYIANQVRKNLSIRQLHGHFCHGATTITWFVSRLTDVPFSFTAHAKDIYQVDQNPGDLLARKLKAARFVTTCTGANATHLGERFPHCDHVHTVYHGLDTAYFAPPDGAQRNAAIPRILAVGRFVQKKGFADLIDACSILRQSGMPFHLTIIGEQGDQSDVIRDQVARLDLKQSIHLRGPVTHDELRREYHRADIFALPCLVAPDGDRDGIPNVLAEAMATGMAVVTTAVSGIPELVRDGVDGLMVPERNPQALAAALKRLLDDRVSREQLGGAARTRVCSVFDSKQTTMQLKSLFVDTMATEEAKA